MGENHDFFLDLIQDKNPNPSTPGQERLKHAYYWVKQRITQLKTDKGDGALKEWLNAISHFEVLEFIEPNEGKASHALSLGRVVHLAGSQHLRDAIYGDRAEKLVALSRNELHAGRDQARLCLIASHLNTILINWDRN